MVSSFSIEGSGVFSSSFCERNEHRMIEWIEYTRILLFHCKVSVKGSQIDFLLCTEKSLDSVVVNIIQCSSFNTPFVLSGQTMNMSINKLFFS